ncbi:MAG TPA: hypothetical protein VNP72_09915, partial [Longimicrobium sp.]|nr:hypothetical protein [Longimicrobium sp.]
RTSSAVFALPDSTTRVRLRAGQRLGTVTVLAIHPRRVDVREDELGVSRMFTLDLVRTRRPVQTGGPPAAAAGVPAQAPTLPAVPAQGAPAAPVPAAPGGRRP